MDRHHQRLTLGPIIAISCTEYPPPFPATGPCSQDLPTLHFYIDSYGASQNINPKPLFCPRVVNSALPVLPLTAPPPPTPLPELETLEPPVLLTSVSLPNKPANRPPHSTPPATTGVQGTIISPKTVRKSRLYPHPIHPPGVCQCDRSRIQIRPPRSTAETFPWFPTAHRAKSEFPSETHKVLKVPEPTQLPGLIPSSFPTLPTSPSTPACSVTPECLLLPVITLLLIISLPDPLMVSCKGKLW